MILKQLLVPTAKWNKEIDNWTVEKVTEYCWTDMQGKEVSPWFNKLKCALNWSIEADQKKIWKIEILTEAPENKKLKKRV